MPVFLISLFKSVSFYIYAALVGVIIALFISGKFKDNAIENLQEELVDEQQAKIRLERSLDEQNARVRDLLDESKQRQVRVEGSNLVIETLNDQGKRVLLELDEQFVPQECRGAIMWGIQKTMEELKP